MLFGQHGQRQGHRPCYGRVFLTYKGVFNVQWQGFLLWWSPLFSSKSCYQLLLGLNPLHGEFSPLFWTLGVELYLVVTWFHASGSTCYQPQLEGGPQSLVYSWPPPLFWLPISGCMFLQCPTWGFETPLLLLSACSEWHLSDSVALLTFLCSVYCLSFQAPNFALHLGSSNICWMSTNILCGYSKTTIASVLASLVLFNLFLQSTPG